MYLALKWLVGLTLTMWVGMCCVDLCIGNNGLKQKGTNYRKDYRNCLYNATKHKKMLVEPTEKVHYKNNYNYSQVTVVLHYLMFFAGAITVTLFDRKKVLFRYTKTLLIKVNVNSKIKSLYHIINIKNNGIQIWDAIQKRYRILWKLMKCWCMRLKITLCTVLKFNKDINCRYLLLILYKRLKQIGQERKELEQLLVATVNENKIIRRQYQLEIMAKNRFERYIINTQKIFKENRSRYVSFQHLYLVTHQENIFLKSRIKRLNEEKDETQHNLFNLVNQIFRSSNSELKAYCSRFIVQTKDNLLNTDVNAEIQKFLKNSTFHYTSINSTRQSRINFKTAINCPKASEAKVTRILPDNTSLVPIVFDAPKLRGLPGEYVWTVKDKDGLIEKLYEYDYSSDLDKGETIRRIREYSVFYDKDCFLDYSNSKMTVPENHPDSQNKYFHYPVRKFVTSSDAFQKFLENNRNVTSLPKSSLPSLDGF